MKSKAEYQKRRREADLIGYLIHRHDPSLVESYARAMMREDKRRYWAKKHRALGPSYERALHVYFGKQVRKRLIDRYYSCDISSMYPTQFILLSVDFASC